MAYKGRKLGYGKMSRQFVEAAVMEIADEKLEEFSKLVYEGMKMEVPKKTRALHDAIRMRKTTDTKYSVYVSSVQLSGDVRNPSHKDYSYIVWKGHRAYTIHAKGKPMRWIGKDGKPHYAWQVNIPASAGNDYVGRAIQYARANF